MPAIKPVMVETLSALIVEGAAERFDTLAEVLKNCGYSAKNAADFDILQKVVAQEKFDLIFCCETLGAQSGLEILKMLQALQPPVPVVFVAESANSEALEQAKLLGATDTFVFGEDVSALYPKLAAIQKRTKPRSKTTIHPVQLTDLEPSPVSTERGNVDMIMDVPVSVNAVLGSSMMQIADLLQLGPGSIVELNKRAGEPVELYVNEKLIAIGEVVVVNDVFGIRITEVSDHRQRVQALE